MREIKFRGYAKEELINSQWITNGYGVAKIEYANGENELCLITQYGSYRIEPKTTWLAWW